MKGKDTEQHNNRCFGYERMSLFLHRQSQCVKTQNLNVIAPGPRYDVGLKPQRFNILQKHFRSKHAERVVTSERVLRWIVSAGASKIDHVFSGRLLSATRRTPQSRLISNKWHSSYLTASDHDVTQEPGQRQPFSLASRFCSCWLRIPRTFRLRRRRWPSR